MTTKQYCNTCVRTVRGNQKALICDSCLSWVHLKCTPLSIYDYQQLKSDSSKWYCPNGLSQIFSFNHIIDDFEFASCLFNQSSSNGINADIVKNEQLKLINKLKICNRDIDSDKYFYSQLDNLGNVYYLEDVFNLMINNKATLTNISVLHINARSLSKNVSHLRDYLTNYKHKFSVSPVTETWATDEN